MSFTLFVDTLRAAVPLLTGFTDKTELPNAYDPASCGEPMLRDGWGLKFGGATETGMEFGSEIANTHSFSIVLTREVPSVDGDPDALITAIKNLKADALTLQREVLSYDKMGLPDAVELIRYDSTDAVAYGNNSEDYKWISTAVNFNATIRESLT